jgi:hypothetical protein
MACSGWCRGALRGFASIVSEVIQKDGQHKSVAHHRPRRKTRKIALEAVPVSEEALQSRVSGLTDLFADGLMQLLNQELASGELAIEQGVIVVNTKRSNE